MRGVFVLSDPAWSEGSRDWVNAGELTAVAAAATNGEIVGSAASDDAPDVSTVRVGNGVVTLGKFRYLSSASSSCVSSSTGFLRYAWSGTSLTTATARHLRYSAWSSC